MNVKKAHDWFGHIAESVYWETALEKLHMRPNSGQATFQQLESYKQCKVVYF